MEVEEVSENLVELQARSQGSELMVDVSNPYITPCEETVFLRYDLGDPFGDEYRFLRIPVPVSEEPLHDFAHFWKQSDFTLSESTLEVTFQPDKEIPVQREEIDILVSVNGYDAAISRLPMSCEYKLESKGVSQAELTDRLSTVKAVQEKIDEQDPVLITDDLTYTDEGLVKLQLDVGGPETIPFTLSPPHPQDIHTSAVMDFINKLGSGSLENLPGNEVYLSLNSGVGSDVWFDKYQLSPNPNSENTVQDSSYTGKIKRILFGTTT